MKLDRIRIKNYKSCLNTSVDLNDHLTALIGVNGVGKSNVLTSIKLLGRLKSNRYYSRNERQLNESSSRFSAELDLNIGAEKVKFKIKLAFATDQNNHDEVFDVSFQIKINGQGKWSQIDRDALNFFNQFNHRVVSNENRISIIGDRYRLKSGDLKKIKIANEVLSFLSGITYFSATHFADPSKCSTSFELEDSRSRHFYRNHKSHDKFLFDLYSAWKDKETNPKFKQFINLIGKDGVNLIDDISFVETELPNSSYEVATGGHIRTIKRNKELIIPIISLDGSNLSFNQLSEGTFKTIALIFYVIDANENLLIIEEPEVCIHHGLLSSIIELIKSESKRKQIIISTHSDYILGKLQPENVLLVSRNSKKGTIVKSLTRTLKKDDYSALKHYLNNTGSLGEYWKEGGIKYE